MPSGNPARRSRILRAAARLGILAVLSGAVAAGTARAQGAEEARPELGLPVDCAIGETCFVQNYFDHDPGPDAVDYTCGGLSYDEHDGTDIRARNLAEMRAGIPVVAAADGVVKATRDGMADAYVRTDEDRAAIGKRKAGNGVVLTHPGGWETQYSHLLRGSVAVRRGERVTRGQQLGLIGLSGLTQFPHVEFVVRRDGEPIDPMLGAGRKTGCGAPGDPLWDQTARSRLRYIATGVLGHGFVDVKPDIWQAREGGLRRDTIRRDAPVLVFWVEIMGAQAQDMQNVTILDPDGRVFARLRDPVPRDKASWFQILGKTRRGGPWAPGVYRATYELTRERDGRTETVLRVEDSVEVRDPS